MQLPQELFDAIVQNIDDHPTLKLCALAAPQLRDPSQRILLHSVTLRGGGWVGNYPTERAILQHSPHIATYITDLTVNIRGLPADALPSLFRPASTLSFKQVHVIGGFTPGGPHDTAIASQVVPGVLCLDLGPECQSLCRVLARPQYAAWTSLLMHLALQADGEIDQESRALIGNAALTLQSFRVVANQSAQHVPLPLPSLPALCALQYDLSLSILNDPQFVAPFLAVLAPAASPRLSDITVILKYTNPSPQDLPPRIRDPAIGALDAALAAHPAHPALKLVWCLRPYVRGFSKRDITWFFDGFVQMVRRALPEAHAREQFIFEHEQGA
ncbi:hypothetical protein DFH08DRAFT_1084069 [Mycena albidolilacea]|uniref:F-box domain-containing protein n=1 Tax=Mycena albidolilacea TaxID=1033008 RepID=A0AAD6ZNM7_9AGAR|nr:hypothetical protein DFH08DRAFT_1084069 [Mycena albidolilacea]